MQDPTRATLSALLSSPRYEVLPLARVEEQVVAHVPRHITVTVTASPALGIDATLGLTELLAGHGFRVVPHLPARMIAGEDHLAELVRRLAALGLDEVFVVAGDRPEPVGRFADALSLLETMGRIGHPFREVGITGYPESHPRIDDDVTIQAMWDKRQFATYIVSNICFDPRVITSWIARVRRRGVTLPVYVGIPGIIDGARLLRIATRIGVGESARFLRWHSNRMLRMLVPGVYRPDRLVSDLVRDLGDATDRVAGLHVFTFNELASTERWRLEQLGRLSGR